jgi:hypothetical protein
MFFNSLGSVAEKFDRPKRDAVFEARSIKKATLLHFLPENAATTTPLADTSLFFNSTFCSRQ